MNGAILHFAFDVAAWAAAAGSLFWLTRAARVRLPPAPAYDLTYWAVLFFGSGIGAVLFGTANLWLSGEPGFARSIEGAIAGGIVAIELYKRLAGIQARTGARFALPFAVGVAVGRIGCYLAGMDDFTYGTPTTLPWGHDFGDGILRHPVQLYESIAMALFAVVYVGRVRRGDRFMIDNGFYLVVGFYAVQRFIWEFFKPYAAVLGPLTLFQLLCAALFAYSVAMIATAPTPHIRSTADDRAIA
jgi:phosphatidylglycerol---prolipoprotein diacylglyceryl transferase